MRECNVIRCRLVLIFVVVVGWSHFSMAEATVEIAEKNYTKPMTVSLFGAKMETVNYPVPFPKTIFYLPYYYRLNEIDPPTCFHVWSTIESSFFTLLAMIKAILLIDCIFIL